MNDSGREAREGQARSLRIVLVFCAALSVIIFGFGSTSLRAQSAGDIVNALKPAPAQGPALTRGLVVGNPAPPAVDPKAASQADFINNMRKTRSISVEAVATPPSADDRAQVAEIARTRPAIDLEILFDYNSYVIGPAAVPALVKLGTALSDPSLKGSVYLINGYTDAAGSPDYNLALSQRRADAVRSMLIQQFQIPPTSLVAVGFGKEQLKNPADPLGDENRRVQIVNTNVTAGH